MKINITISIWFFFLTQTGYLNAQTLNHPNSGLKSHETLEISKIEISANKTVISLGVENRITGGYFCADKNIFIIYPDGTRSRLTSSKGIPVCPETYKFRTIGEKLNFELTFPPLKQGTQWIELIEDCSENCFSFYGVCLNRDLNKKIDDASLLAENGMPAEALINFIKIAGTIDSKNSGIEGLIYINIITLAKETANIQKAAEWYAKLKSSGIPRSELYIKHLNSQGIMY
ncbi:MAG: hypothetical protein ABR927_10410 [Bacteroidales bacterium]|jgi:hypothetical protein